MSGRWVVAEVAAVVGVEVEDGVVAVVVVAVGEAAVGEEGPEGGEADVSVARQRLASTSECRKYTA